MKNKAALSLAGAGILGGVLLATLPANAQTTATQPVLDTANSTVTTAGQTANNVAGQLPGTVSSVGNAAGNVVGGLQPTLQPVGQGVGSALNNLTQPDNVSSLLEFLSSIVPNHIEAHVNLDALRVDKVTLDIRGVDLRNLKVDLLVANSRNAGAVKPALTGAGRTSTTGAGTNLNLTPNANTTDGTSPVTFTAPADSTSTTAGTAQ